MKKRMNKDNWEKTVIVEGREFRIKFWYDSWNFFYTLIEEKVIEKPTWFNKKGYRYEAIRSEYWIDETKTNPIETALMEIKKCLNTEKELNKLEKMLDKFCQ